MKKISFLLALAFSSQCYPNNVEYETVLHLIARKDSSYENICTANKCTKHTDVDYTIAINNLAVEAIFTPLSDLFHFWFKSDSLSKTDKDVYLSGMSNFLAKNGFPNRIYGNYIIGENNLLIEIYNNTAVYASNPEYAAKRLRKRLVSDRNLQMHLPGMSNVILGVTTFNESEFKGFVNKFKCKEYETNNQYTRFTADHCTTPDGNTFSIYGSANTHIVYGITYRNCSSAFVDFIKEKNKQFQWKTIENPRLSHLLKAKATLFNGGLGSIRVYANNEVSFEATGVLGTRTYVADTIKSIKEEYAKRIKKDKNGFLK